MTSTPMVFLPRMHRPSRQHGPSATSPGVGLPRSDGQGWWLGQAMCVRACWRLVVSNSSGGQVAQGAVQPGAVVPGDVVHGGAAGPSSGGPGLLVETLALQGREERLGQRVVPALPGAAGRQGDRQVRSEGGVVAAGVLATAIGMEHHPGCGSRAATALVNASATSSVRRCSARAKPTTRREAMSITVASYSHPSQVGMEVMSPHQRVLTAAALTAKSRRIRSRRGRSRSPGSLGTACRTPRLGAAVHQRAHGRVAPAQGVHQARHQLSSAASRRPARGPTPSRAPRPRPSHRPGRSLGDGRRRRGLSGPAAAPRGHLAICEVPGMVAVQL
jgi:hypothetical protein